MGFDAEGVGVVVGFGGVVGVGVGAGLLAARLTAGMKTGSPETWLSMTVAKAKSAPPAVIGLTIAYPSARFPQVLKASLSWRKP